MGARDRPKLSRGIAGAVILAVTVAASAPASALPTAPAALDAVALVDTGAVQAALGGPVTGPEDDGGAPVETAAGSAFRELTHLPSSRSWPRSLQVKSVSSPPRVSVRGATAGVTVPSRQS